MAATERAGVIAAIVASSIGQHRAVRVDGDEVVRFPEEDVKAILNQLDPTVRKAGSSEPCGPRFNRHVEPSLGVKMSLHGLKAASVAAMMPAQLAAAAVLAKNGHYEAIRKELPAATAGVSSFFSNTLTFAKPSTELVKQSVQYRQALCVNRKGKLRLMTSGYVVCSHVWGETMGWQTPTTWGPVELSIRKKGIAIEHLERIVDRCEAEWIWLDVVAMPEVLEDMSPAEKRVTEHLRVDIINTLHTVYTNADKVVLLDSLCLRLRSSSMIDAAVIFCLGFSMTRLWIFTECRLAKSVCIKTADSEFYLDEIIEFLKSKINNDQHRYWNLLARLEPLRPTQPGSSRFRFYTSEQHRSNIVPLLDDIYFAAETRYSDVEVDHVRIMFPVLNLQWGRGWTTKDGFRYLLNSFPDQHDTIRKYFAYRDNQITSTTWTEIQSSI